VLGVAVATEGDELLSTTFARPNPAAIRAVATSAPSAAHRPRRSGDLDGVADDGPDALGLA
jgi:hypothetical protein